MTASAMIRWRKGVKNDGPGENYLMREFSKLLEQLWETAEDWRPLNLESVGGKTSLWLEVERTGFQPQLTNFLAISKHLQPSN